MTHHILQHLRLTPPRLQSDSRPSLARTVLCSIKGYRNLFPERFQRGKRFPVSQVRAFSARKKFAGIPLTAAGILLVSIALLLPSCTSRFELLNTNPNQVTAEQMEANNYRVGTKIVSMQSLVIPVEEHMYQFNESLTGGPFAGYIGSTVDTWLTRFETFNPSADWRAWPFANVITEFYAPYRGIVDGTDDEVANAFASLLRVAVLNRVTDSYGPMPYSDALTNESITVRYDSQEEVYMQMFAELDAAIEAFGNNTGCSRNLTRR